MSGANWSWEIARKAFSLSYSPALFNANFGEGIDRRYRKRHPLEDVEPQAKPVEPHECWQADFKVKMKVPGLGKVDVFNVLGQHIATLLDTAPKQAAGTTLLSTLFALVFIPLMVAVVFP